MFGKFQNNSDNFGNFRKISEKNRNICGTFRKISEIFRKKEEQFFLVKIKVVNYNQHHFEIFFEVDEKCYRQTKFYLL